MSEGKKPKEATASETRDPTLFRWPQKPLPDAAGAVMMVEGK